MISVVCKAKTKPARKGGHKRRDSQQYWELRLKQCGLSMDRGHDEHRLIYGYDFGRDGLDFDGRTVYKTDKRIRGESGE